MRRACTALVRIDMAAPGGGAAGEGEEGLVDSLNVSVAAGIMLHRLMGAARKGRDS